MANKEIYKLGIKVSVDGAEESKKKLSAMEKYVQQTEKRMKALNKIVASPTAKIKDNTSSAIDKINNKTKSLNRAVISPTARINDQATSKLDRLGTTIKRLENSNIKVTSRINDQTSTYLNKVQAKADKLKNAKINPTAEVSDKASDKLDKINAKAEKVKSKKIKPKIEVEDKASDTIEKTKSKTEELDKKKAKIKIQAQDEATQTINKIENKIGSFVKSGAKKIISIGLAGTLALGGIGLGSSMKTFTDFESAMSTVQATSMTTKEDLVKLTEKAKEMGAKSVFSATESAEALNYMAMAGWKTDQMMGGIEGIMNLAAASGEDLAMTSDIVTDALTAFGMQASDSGKFADILAAASSNANTNVHLLGESFKYVAATSGAMKYSAEDTSIALGLMANAGIKGSMGGTALKNAIVNMVSPTDTMAAVMDRYNLSLTDSEGKMKSLKSVVDMLREKMGGLDEATQAAAAADLFGKEAMSGMLSIINASQSDYDKLTNAIYNSSGAAQTMSETRLDNLKGQIEELSGAVETMKIDLATKLAPYAKQFVTWLTGKMPEITNKVVSFVDYISKNIGTIKTMATTVLGLGTAFTAMSAIGKIGSSISGFMKVVNTLKGVSTVATTVVGETGAIASNLGKISLLGKALPALFSPVGLAIAGAVGIAGAAIVGYNNLMKESVLKTTEELGPVEKIINSMEGHVIKSKKEMQELGLIYDEFGDGISDGFKESAREASKSLLKIEMDIKRLRIGGIDENKENTLKNWINDFAYEGINAIKERRSELQKEFDKTFNLDGVITESEQGTLDYLDEYFEEGINKELNVRDSIYEFASEKIKEHGTLLDEDMKEIKLKLTELKSIELEYANAKNEKEQKYASEKFGRDASKVANIDEASELVKSRGEEFNKTTEDIYKNYSDTLYDLNSLMEKETNGQKKEMLKTQIEATTKMRDEALQKAREAWNSDLETLYSHYPNARGLLNEETGEAFNNSEIASQKKMNSIITSHPDLNKVTESGVYTFQDKDTKVLETLYVNVDEITGKIRGVLNGTNEDIGAYSDQQKEKLLSLQSNYESVATIMQKLTTDQAKLNTNTSEIFDRYGETIGNLQNIQVNGELVDSLENVKLKEDDVITGIINVNGTPLMIKSNAQGFIQQMYDAKKAVESIPRTKTVSVISNVAIQTAENFIGGIGQKATGTNYYTGNGLSTVDERGWELSEKKSVPIIGQYNRNPLTFMSKGTKILNHMQSVNDMKEEVDRQVNSKISSQPQNIKYEVQQTTPHIVQSGVKGISIGDIKVNINNTTDTDEIVELASQEVGRKLREAIANH